MAQLQRRRTIERLERVASRQAAIAELARTALAGTPLSDLLARAAGLVVEQVGVESCRILELSPNGGLRRVTTAGSETTPLRPAGDPTTLDLLAGAALRSAAPVTAPHLVLEPDGGEAPGGLTGCLSVRIDGSGQPFGVLTAFTNRARIFEPEELEFAAAVASVLAAAISRRQAEDAIRYQALHDPLTGLPNGTLLRDRLRQAVELARRSGDSVGVLLADLDGFRAVNDALGHATGDAVLVGVAERLGGRLRASDTLARLGGDEFAICLPGLRTVDQATSVAVKLCAVLDRPMRLGELSVPLSASVGVAVFPQHGSEASVLLQRADAAMYRAKARREPVSTYEPQPDASHPRRLSLAAELARAIEDDELELDYQPLVDLSSGSVGSVEALVRWRGAAGEVLSASDLIFLAEHSGLIRPLSAWVLGQAVRQLGEWEAQGLDLRVAVNVSGVVLEDAGFRRLLADTLRSAQISPGRLALEITESVLLSEHARASLTSLAEDGVTISIDDFGTGYASLSYLKHLPVNQLKVDRSFVTRLAMDGRDLAIVRSVIELAHALGLQVVAEGVEDAAAAELLRGLSADLAQGYLFCRPVGPERLAAWVTAWPAGQEPPPRQLTLPEVPAAAGP